MRAVGFVLAIVAISFGAAVRPFSDPGVGRLLGDNTLGWSLILSHGIGLALCGLVSTAGKGRAFRIAGAFLFALASGWWIATYLAMPLELAMPIEIPDADTPQNAYGLIAFFVASPLGLLGCVSWVVGAMLRQPVSGSTGGSAEPPSRP